MKKVLLASLALLLLAFFALPAMATIVVDNTLVTQDVNHFNINGLFYGNGNPIRLFEPPAPASAPPDTSLLWGNNNTSTLFDGANPPGNYPDYVPSPSGSGGEAFDIEGVLWRYNPSSDELRVWVVTSIGPTGVPWNNGTEHYVLGDVFINTDHNTSTGVGGYEYALISFDGSPPQVWSDSLGTTWNGTGRDAGDLVSLDADNPGYGVNGPSSYVGNSTIRGEANPWAVVQPDDLVSGGNDLLYQQVSGSIIEGLDRAVGCGPTFVYFFDVFVDLSDTVLQNLLIPDSWHVTVQCANDESGGSGSGGGGRVPVPGALILGIIGAGLVGLRRRMKA